MNKIERKRDPFTTQRHFFSPDVSHCTIRISNFVLPPHSCIFLYFVYDSIDDGKKREEN